MDTARRTMTNAWEKAAEAERKAKEAWVVLRDWTETSRVERGPRPEA